MLRRLLGLAAARIQRFLQYLCPEDFKYAFGNDKAQQERSETDATSQKDTTRTNKAITTMNSVQQCTTQQHSTTPPLSPVPEVSPHYQRPWNVAQFHNNSPTHTDRKRIGRKVTPQCKQQSGGIGLALVAKDRSSRNSKRKRQLASEESSSIYRRPRRFITGFNEPMII